MERRAPELTSTNSDTPGRHFLLRGRNLLIAVLLVLAGLQCVRCIFFDNVSFINLEQYSQGTERNPFQSRVAMMPLLRLAGTSHALTRAAHSLDEREREQIGRKVAGSAEPMTAMKLMCVAAGVASVLGSLAVLSAYGQRFGELWWLPAALMLVILYVSFAARAEQAYWYPYDLPHMFLFGSACLCILTGRPWLMLLLFVLDTPFRETSIYLVPLSLSMIPWRMPKKNGLLLAGIMLVLWILIREPIVHHFAHNTSEVAGRLPRNFANLVSPLHIGQVASALGFLLIPVYLARRFLAPNARAFLWLAVPCLLVTAYFGIWIESRIAVEWTVPFAVLATAEFMQAWAISARPRTIYTASYVNVPPVEQRRAS